ncbi:MAG: DNA polymerase I, partial [Clostridia bacterium]|nr:DNA polymerase I [Clostridia bacterium]
IEKWVYDYKNFHKKCASADVKLENVIFDSLLAGYLLSPAASEYSLTRLAREYDAPIPETCSEDETLKSAALHKCVCETLFEKLNENAQLDLLLTIELPLAKVLGDMETEGFLVDADGIRGYSEELGGRIETLQNEIFDHVGYEFNLNSPKQLGIALFEDLGLPVRKKTKSGYSTNADVLESLKYAHPAVSLLLEYRHLQKLKSTYCEGLIKEVSADGRIHSTFNQTETRTGRISSTEPNLQNIPVRSEEGRQFRRFFVAKDGYVLCDADYSQIELRVLAHMANDQNMISAFKSGTDIHTLTASEVFDVPVEFVTPTMRSHAKAVNFGIVYGIGAFSLSKDIGVTRAEADKYIKGYLATYPQVDEYMNSTIENAKRDGFVTTLFGRRRYLPELSSSNGMLRAFGERVARNMPIQGTAADIIKIAMIRVSERLTREKLDAKLILQVHDELIVEAREDLAQTVCNIITEEMENAAMLSLPLSVDAAFGKTWYEAKR